MVEGPPSADIEASAPRLCRTCGERFAADDAAFCTSCGTRWSPAPPADNAANVVRLIEEVQRWRQDARIDAATYASLRQHLEERLSLVNPARPASVAPPAVASPPRPPAPPRLNLRQWASARQADLLLYLGAFLLVVAALVFVGGRGDGLSATARLGVLGAVHARVRRAGVLVPRWERVREAGPVFLALGALLAPLNVLFWYTEVLSEQGVPADWVWLFGSLASTALYGVLYFRGYGSLYRIPAGLAAVNVVGGALRDQRRRPAVAGVVAHVPRAPHRGGGRALPSPHEWSRCQRRQHRRACASRRVRRGRTRARRHVPAPADARAPYRLFGVVGLHRGWPALLPAACYSSHGDRRCHYSGRSTWTRRGGSYPPLLLGAVTLATRQRWAPLSEWLAGFGWLFAGRRRPQHVARTRGHRWRVARCRRHARGLPARRGGRLARHGPSCQRPLRGRRSRRGWCASRGRARPTLPSSSESRSAGSRSASFSSASRTRALRPASASPIQAGPTWPSRPRSPSPSPPSAARGGRQSPRSRRSSSSPSRWRCRPGTAGPATTRSCSGSRLPSSSPALPS